MRNQPTLGMLAWGTSFGTLPYRRGTGVVVVDVVVVVVPAVVAAVAPAAVVMVVVMISPALPADRKFR